MLEHIAKPWIAVDEMHRVLTPGGLAVCTTCSYNPIHWGPKDYYRFLPDGLKELFGEFINVSVKSWGNKLAIVHDIATDGNRQTLPEAIQDLYLSTNDSKFPWTIWVTANKSQSG